MSRIVLPAFAAILAVLTLSACGGNQNSQPAAQDKHLSRSTKQANSPYASAVQELYVAYFGRPADPAGLTNFENALAAAGAPTDIDGLTAAYSTNQSVRSLIDSFGTSKESQTLYGSGSTQDFVTAVFNNVLGRAPQTAGLTYWSDAIDNGSLSKGDAALAIMDGALTNTTAQGLIDAQLVKNRLAVAASFTTEVASQNATYAYSGATAAAAVRTMLGQVNAQTDVDSLASTITAVITSLLHSAPGVSLLAGDIRSGINLNNPAGMARDSAGNLYVSDGFYNVINKIAPDGSLTVIAGTSGVKGSADGNGASASFNGPGALALDSAGNVYVVDSGNDTVRKITPDGTVSTLAGTAGQAGSTDGTGPAASFNLPTSIVIDAHDNIYVGQWANGAIRKISTAGVVTTMNAFGGPCGNSSAGSCFGGISALAMDAGGNFYVADSYYATVRKMTPGGLVSILAGTPGVYGAVNGQASAATFEEPQSIAVDSAGNVYVGDGIHQDFDTETLSIDITIRMIAVNGTVSTVAGKANSLNKYVDGPAASAQFGGLTSLMFDASGNLLICDYLHNAIRLLSPAGTVSTLYGKNGFIGAADGTGASAQFYLPQGIVADGAGNLYVADSLNDTIRMITPAGVVTTAYGQAQNASMLDGQGTSALLYDPVGLAIDASGNMVVVETGADAVRRISAAGMVSTLLSSTVVNTNGFTFNFILSNDATIDTAGNVYITDSYGGDVYEIASGGAISILAGYANVWGSTDGTGRAARFKQPTGIAMDAAGNFYVADTGNSTIRKITPAGVVTTLAGTAGITGSADGSGGAASFNHPMGVALDSTGNLYVADSGNNLIRKVTPAGVVSTVAGTVNAGSTLLGPLPGAINNPQYLTMVGDKTLYVTTANAVVQVNLP